MTRKLFWEWMLVFAAIGCGVFLSLGPWQKYREQRALADRAVAERRAAEKSRAELTQRKAGIESSVGREELARDAGYRKPGEVPVGDAP